MRARFREHAPIHDLLDVKFPTNGEITYRLVLERLVAYLEGVDERTFANRQEAREYLLNLDENAFLALAQALGEAMSARPNPGMTGGG